MSSQPAEPAQDEAPPSVEEIYYRKGDIDFCFLLNRRHQNLRVFDYRVGNYQQKRDFFDRIARAEGLRKVFTVVEKQDSKSWRSVGFSREGAIPGYFRTADAYVMSRVYTEDGEPIQGGAPKLNAPSVSAKEKTSSKPRGLNTELVESTERLAAITEELAEVCLYAPFRRGIFHPDVALHARHNKNSYWVGAETDSSFGHAKLDYLTPPKTEAQLPALEFMMSSLLDELARRETASVFSLVPADWTLTAQLYNALGFKVSARLTDHVVRDDGFVGAQLWHRRLSTAAAPRLSSILG
ncbi:MAG: hypothetical protein H6713_05070 [Myxococcales bacterium]|nr:hypothetical protein [Myxococcales bacterium]MCB9749365.1 hypothetical protein [Myxococcales bacterium]